MTGTDLVPLGRPERRERARWLAPVSVVLGSMATLLPFIATVPILPPFGLMVLLGWRMHRGDSMPVWASVPLGFVDDVLSGQPVGTAMVLWTACILAMDVLDARLVWRDFWQDWLIATGFVAFFLVSARLLATPFAAHVDTALLIQVVIASALLPLVFRLCAWMDRDVKKN